MKKGIIVDLLKNQKDAIEKIQNISKGQVGHTRNGALLCSPFGSGKTLMAIVTALHLTNGKGPCLVVTQLSPSRDYIISGNVHFRPSLKSMFLGNATEARMKTWYEMKHYDLIVTNYETLVQAHVDASEYRSRIIRQELTSNRLLSTKQRETLETFLAEHEMTPRLDRPIPLETLATRELVTATTDARLLCYHRVWPMLIADEAHEIRTIDASRFRAASQLRSEFRLIITATPFNNSIDDIVALFMLAGIHPSRETSGIYLEETIDAWKSLSSSSSSSSVMDEYCGAIESCRDLYMIRGEKDGTARAYYKPTDIVWRQPFLTSIEQKIYDDLSHQLMNLTTLVRCRQLCSGIFKSSPPLVEDSPSPLLVEDSPSPPSSPLSSSSSSSSSSPSSSSSDEERVKCSHYYCELSKSAQCTCVSMRTLDDPKQTTKTKGKKGLCHEEILFPKEPTKFLMTMVYLREVVLPRQEKIVIFCEFLETVKQLSSYIQRVYHRLPVFTATGSTSSSNREVLCRRFAQVNGSAVLLCTHIFNQGVNLPCANHTILFDIWWNPVVNSQASGRCERPSQTKSVFVLQLLVANTIEDNIWMIAHKKDKIGSTVIHDHIDDTLVQKITNEFLSDERHLRSRIAKSLVAPERLRKHLSSVYHVQLGFNDTDVNIFEPEKLVPQIPQTIPLTPTITTPSSNYSSSSYSSSSSSSSKPSHLLMSNAPSFSHLPKMPRPDLSRQKERRQITKIPFEESSSSSFSSSLPFSSSLRISFEEFPSSSSSSSSSSSLSSSFGIDNSTRCNPLPTKSRFRGIGIGTDTVFSRTLARHFDNHPLRTHPDPVDISNILDQQTGVPQPPNVDFPKLSNIFWVWLQFIDHDLILTKNGPVNDSLYAGHDMHPLVRTQHRLDQFGRRQQINFASPYLDGSHIYGNSLDEATSLRRLDGSGKLRSSFTPSQDALDNELLPVNGETGQFEGADPRIIEHPLLFALHVLWVREHNYWCDRLTGDYPHMNENELYNTARHLVIAELQVITYKEVLPLLVGRRDELNYKCFNSIHSYHNNDDDDDDNDDNSLHIFNEFGAAVFRLGHTLVTEVLQTRNPLDGELLDTLQLAEVFNDPTYIEEEGISSTLLGASKQLAEVRDARIVDAVRKHLFNNTVGSTQTIDLMARNIARGRDHQLPPYEAFYHAVTGDWKPSCRQIFYSPLLCARIAQVYGDDAADDGLDLFLGILSERRHGTSIMGIVGTRILIEQFKEIKHKDRHFYLWDHVIEEHYRLEIQSTRLSHIILRNTRIPHEKLQENVFIL